MSESATAAESTSTMGSVPVACAWCGAAESTLQGRPPRWLDYELRQCGRCGVVFTAPHPTAETLERCYAEAYYGPRDERFAAAGEQLVRWFRHRRAAAIRAGQPPGRVLDIGCGRGHTLAALRHAGWNVAGVERNDAAAEYARQVHHLDVATGGLQADCWPCGSFDAVILWHVLEHLADARQVLNQCSRLLVPGGRLHLAVPNLSSWQAVSTGYSWFHLDLPRHLFHFRAQWLQQRLCEAGLRVVRVRHFCWEQNPYGWVQSLLNRAGLPHNLLYDLLRRGPARRVRRPWRECPARAAASVVAGALLLPPAVALAVAEAMVRRGGTVQIVAQRVEA